MVGSTSDYGYNQAVYTASQQLAKDMPNVDVITADHVPENNAVTQTMQSMVNKGAKKWVVGSNRILLDLYGPVGASAPLVTVDGVAQAPSIGTDRGHAVWRVIVPILPGQQRVVRAVVVQPVDLQNGDAPPQVIVQPMAIPATATVGLIPQQVRSTGAASLP